MKNLKEQKRIKKKQSPDIDTVVQILHDRTGYAPAVIKHTLYTFVDELPKMLVDYGSVVIMNLGTWTLVPRINSINPKTQERLQEVVICPTFKQSKTMRQALIREQGEAKTSMLEEAMLKLAEADKYPPKPRRTPRNKQET